MIKGKRIVSLDYLRGFMAVSILIYHYSNWTNIDFFYPLDDLIDRLGIYGVTLFYIMGGATLAIGYSGKELDVDFVKTFFLKRFAKIVPLFYIVTTITVILNIVASNQISRWDLFVNYSLIFGWVDPDGYIATGAWFIGNQLVFYSIFPFMLYLVNKSLKRYIIFFMGTIFLSLFFSYYLIDSTIALSEQWQLYINPLNQLFYFSCGFFIGWLKKYNKLNIETKKVGTLFYLSILIFVFLPVSGNNQIGYVTGLPKIIFTATLVMLFISLLNYDEHKNNLGKTILQYFGTISYSLYLMHPVAFSIIKIWFPALRTNNKYLLILTSITLTLLLSSASYLLVERKMAEVIISMKQKKIISAHLQKNNV